MKMCCHKIIVKEYHRMIAVGLWAMIAILWGCLVHRMIILVHHKVLVTGLWGSMVHRRMIMVHHRAPVARFSVHLRVLAIGCLVLV